MRQVETRLAAVLEKERRDAIGYAVLTVLCTPFFVVLISLVVMFIIGLVFRYSYHYWNAKTFYTVINLFLASMAVFVLWGANPRENRRKFDSTLLASVGVLPVLLFVTYGTSLLERSPPIFAIVYIGESLFILALFGRVYAKMPVVQDFGGYSVYYSLPLVIFGLVAMAYGEIASGSWLWIPPGEDEIRAAAWVLRRLVVEEKWSLARASADRPILGLLFRLKYIQIKDGELQPTPRGRDFIEAASQDEYAVE